MSPVPPWDICPALELPRLVTLARLAVDARTSALADAKRSEGDTNWGIGCRAYERFLHRLTRAATSGELPWLDLLREGLSLTIVVDGVLVRAYTGRADKPDAKHIQAAQLEVVDDDRQLALPFFGGAVEVVEEDGPWVWLMAVETGHEGQVVRVTFFQANGAGRTRNAWDVPMDLVSPPPEPPKPARPAARPAKKERVAPQSGLLFGAV